MATVASQPVQSGYVGAYLMVLREPGSRYGKTARDSQFCERDETPPRFATSEIWWSATRQVPFLYQGSTFYAARTILHYKGQGYQGHGRGNAWVTFR